MTIWCGFWFEDLWCGLLSFSFRAFLFDFGLCPFWWVPSVLRSILVTLRHIYFLQCSSFGEVDFVDLETRFCFPFWVSSFRWSRFCWPRGTNLFLQCASFGGVDRFDPEARIWFLQCTYFNRVDFIDPEARDYFLQWITLWHPDSGLFGNFGRR